MNISREKISKYSLLSFFISLFIITWVAARVLGDNYFLFQIPSYIPIHIPFVLGILLVSFVLIENKSIKLPLEKIMYILIGLAPLLIGAKDYRFKRNSYSESDKVSCFWWHIDPNAKEEQAEAINLVDADIVFLLHGSYLGWNKHDLKGRNIYGMGKFRLHTNYEIIEHQPLIARKGIWVHGLKINIPKFKKSLIIWMVDLPSDIFRSKRQLLVDFDNYTKKIHQTNPSLSDPDMVIGDFNMPRHSKVLNKMFPSMLHAYDHAGLGLTFSFPSKLPLWLIDHVFIKKPLIATYYSTPTISRKRRHNPQIFHLRMQNTTN